MNNNFNQAIVNRRTVYAIGKNVTHSPEEIRQLVEHAVKYTPSPINSQSARVVVLMGSNHDRLWDIVRETLKKIVPAESFASTDAKLASFQAGFGTVLFFEEQQIVKGLQEQFALYSDNFPIWSLQSNGMLEYVIWTALADIGIGASLQHYNPLIDDEVRKTWNLPDSWKLLAQMPFGSIEADPGAKEFSPIEDRVKFFRD